MLSRLVRYQLVAFVVVAVTALSVLAVYYLRIPQAAGLRTYPVGLDLPQASGLYDGAPVTLRGVQVGQIQDLGLTPDGVHAQMQVHDGVQIPSDATARVTLASALGEAGVDLVGSSTSALPAGASLRVRPGALPTSTAGLLQAANQLLTSVPRQDLTTTIDALARGFGGNAHEMGGLLDAGSQLTSEAVANEQPTFGLLHDLAPVLATQRDLRGSISRSSRDLATLTHVLAQQRSTLTSLLQASAPMARDTTSFLAGVHGTLARTVRAGDQMSQVLNVYVPGLRQMLIVFPALLEAEKSVQPLHPDPKAYVESALSFKLSLNDPPVCTQGFADAGQQRDPGDESPAPLPKDSYCKVAHDDPRVVRGARNDPCPNDAARRGATAIECGLIFDPAEIRKGAR